MDLLQIKRPKQNPDFWQKKLWQNEKIVLDLIGAYMKVQTCSTTYTYSINTFYNNIYW